MDKKKIRVKSPTGKIEAIIRNKNGKNLSLVILKHKQPILNINTGKFIFNKKIFRNSYFISGVKQNSTNRKWEPIFGEKKLIPNIYTKIIITLKGKDPSLPEFKLICRVYDVGIAFRYKFNKKAFNNLILRKELTTFNFNKDYKAWVTNNPQGRYRKEKISNIKSSSAIPLVIERNVSSFVAIGEAALGNYAQMRLIKNPKQQFSLRVQLASEVNLNEANYTTPWRYVMTTNGAGKLLERNYFVLNLNNPNKLKDVAWIKPGKVLREVTLTTQGGKACIDYAAKHNIQYVEFDAGWYGKVTDYDSDATTATVDPNRSAGPLDLQCVIKYAKEKGVGIILYLDHRAVETQLDELLPLYESWGIKGMKFGFVYVGPQKWASWLHRAIRKAAKHHLMVDVHDNKRPTGYSRTYPNWMTQEGVRGDEESPSIQQTLITLFTRMIAGPADYTNCYFTNRVSKKMGGKAAQMAKAIMIYSPWQFIYWYDRPKNSPTEGGAGSTDRIIKDNTNTKFYDLLPTVWHDTRVLEGIIGKYATIARKYGDNWYLGSLVANHERTINIPLAFLDQGQRYKAEIFYQTDQDLTKNKVKIKRIDVSSQSVLIKKLAANSGLAVIFKKL